MLMPPDAILDHGVIRDWASQEALPNYEGLVCAVVHGQSKIFNSYIRNGERRWQFIHDGAYLDQKQIDQFLKEKGDV